MIPRIEHINTYDSHGSICVSIAYFGYPHYIFVSSSYDNSIKVWKQDNSKPLKTLTNHCGAVSHIHKWNSDTLISCSISNHIIAFSITDILNQELERNEGNGIEKSKIFLGNSFAASQVLRISKKHLVVAMWDEEVFSESSFLILSFKYCNFKVLKEIKKHSMMDETKLLKSENFKNSFYFNDGERFIHLLNYQTEKYRSFNVGEFCNHVFSIHSLEIFTNKKKEEVLIFSDSINSVFFCKIDRTFKISKLHEHKISFNAGSFRCYLNRVLVIGGYGCELCMVYLDDFSDIAKKSEIGYSNVVYDVQFIVNPEIEEIMKNEKELLKSISLRKLQVLTSEGRKVKLFSVDGLSIKIDPVFDQAKEDLEERISFLKVEGDIFNHRKVVKFFDVTLYNKKIECIFKILL